MAKSYTYNITNDFPDGAVNATKFHNEIEASTDITTTLVGVSVHTNSNTVQATFNSALSASEKTALDGDTSSPAGGLIAAHDNTPHDETDIKFYLDRTSETTDPVSGITGPWDVMQILMHRRELYNDESNPIYESDKQPILGADGVLNDHAARVLNLETIHGKLGWHNQELLEAAYRRPKDLLIYYGWLNSFNSASNSWNNEKVAQDMAKHKLLVFGDGLQDTGHGDYSNTEIIIPRIQALNPEALIFGYVTANQSLANFQTKVDQWGDLGVDGIFIDEAGYDFGKNRAEFNERVDYVHGGTVANYVFANAWNVNHILGTEEDTSYPNETWNSGLAESSLTEDDWILLESFAINTTAYSGSGGYEGKSDWATRGSRMNTLRAVYGVNFAGVGIINNGNGSGQDLFDFGFISALMWSLGAFGTSDTSYASGTAAVTHWTRPNTYDIGKVWTVNPSVQVDVGDSDVYHRYVELAKLSLDFSTSAQSSSITKF